MQENAVEFRHISMEFPGVLANDDVSLDIRKGEVFALVGENGAGKTTLMNILYGIHEPTNGEVYIRGRKVERFSPKTAISMGVGMVHQHFMLVPSFTVAQNIVMSREPRRLGVLFDNKAAEAAAQKLVEEYGLVVDPAAVVREIGVGLQQRVEILKTLYRGADILILDEPTAVLTPQETDELFAVIRRVVRELGMTVIIITHKLYEVMAISDRVGVMRKGRLIGVENTCDVDEKKLASMMVGRPVLYDRLEKTGEAGAEPEYLIVSSGFTKTVTGAPGATITLDAANSNTPIDVTTTGTIETIASHATVTAQAALNTADVTLKLRLYIATSGSNTFNYTGTEYDYTPNLTGTVNANTLLTLNQTNVGQAVTEGDRLLFVLVADDSQSPATSTPISLAVSASVGIE